MDGFSFNDVEYGGDNGIFLMKIPGFFNEAPGKFSIEDNASTAGSLYAFQGNRGKTLVVDFAVIGASLEALYSRIDEIKIGLRGSLGEKVLKLWFEDSLIIPRQYRAFVLGELLVDIVSNYSATCSVQFFVSSGLAETQTEYEEVYTISTSPQTVIIPEGSGEVVAGTMDALPVFLIKNTGAMLSQLILENTTSGFSCTWNGLLQNGEWLRLDAKRMHAEKSVNSGTTWTSVVSGLSGTDSPLKLSPRLVNTLKVTGLTGGTVTVTYRGRFS